jgi:hypothetical protein
METIELNPNCSELVLRLNENMSKREALRMLESIGIKEIEIPNKEFYGEWAIGDENTKLLADKDNPNSPDFDNHATLVLSEGYMDERDGLSIVAHQHCQHQLFPTLDKIERELGLEVEPWDGGSTNAYEEWCSERTHDEIKPLTRKSRQKRKKYCGW